MEGRVARRYAEQRRSGTQMEAYRRHADELTAGLADGAEVLEVAPGPGYLAIEMARTGRFRVTGLDISHTFVEIASKNVGRSGIDVEFRLGDAADMPFDSESFDLVVSQAAFKNFSQPARALDEFHRVLRSGSTAIIQDMSSGASRADIAEEVNAMALDRASAFLTKAILLRLRRRAYSPLQFEHLVADSAFRTCEIRTAGIGLEVRLHKQPAH
jgi:ubiquinone/menaquinone biosynthesis C-methylase UbiE